MDTSDIYYEMCSKAFPRDAKRGVAFKTQDQLQEMVEPVVGYPNNLVCDFWEWFDKCNGIDNDIAFTSMEQLWLAFVMKEKYNKVWDGNDWVKEMAK